MRLSFSRACSAESRHANGASGCFAPSSACRNGLGELNDIAAYEERIAAIGIRRRRSSAKRAFATGLLTGRRDARIDAAMATATRAHGDPAKVRRFWQ
jgi:hypothetical protein